MRFQFKKVVPVLTFALAVICSFAFRSVNSVRHDCVWFVYTPSQPPSATIGQARTANNWTYSATEPTCPGTSGYLCAICVPFDEIYDQDTEEPEDDKPQVDISTTDAYQGLPFALSGTTWSDVDHPSGFQIHVRAKN